MHMRLWTSTIEPPAYPPPPLLQHWVTPSTNPRTKRKERKRKIVGFRTPWDAKSVRNNKWKQWAGIVEEEAAQPKELVRRCFECAMHNWLAMQRKGDVRVLGAYTHYKWASCREPPHWEPWELWNIPDASVTALWFPESPLGTWSKGQNGKEGFGFVLWKIISQKHILNQTHNNVLWNCHYSTRYSSYLDWIWGYSI